MLLSCIVPLYCIVSYFPTAYGAVDARLSDTRTFTPVYHVGATTVAFGPSWLNAVIVPSRASKASHSTFLYDGDSGVFSTHKPSNPIIMSIEMRAIL